MKSYIVTFKDGGYTAKHITNADSIIDAINKSCDYLNYAIDYCIKAEVYNSIY